jgi:hypothetical protein
MRAAAILILAAIAAAVALPRPRPARRSVTYETAEGRFFAYLMSRP